MLFELDMIYTHWRENMNVNKKSQNEQGTFQELEWREMWLSYG